MKLRVKKRTLQTVVVLIGITILGASLFILLLRWEAFVGTVETASDPYPDCGKQVVSYNGESYALREDLETILLIGVDKYEAETGTGTETYNNTQQGDFLLLAVLDHKNETYTVLQLNRDTMADITMLGVRGEKAGTFYGQLALAHTYGSGGRNSCLNTVEAVSNLLYGIDIDHYIAFTMDAVARTNDLSGGVQIEMLEDFSAIDPAMDEGAVVTLKGEQALTYVRTRKGLDDTTNLSRMERQRQYLNALMVKVQTCMEQNDSFMFNAVTEISGYMESDCTVEQLTRLLEETKEYQRDDIIMIEGESVQGKEFMEFYVDENALRLLIISNLYEPYEEVSLS